MCLILVSLGMGLFIIFQWFDESEFEAKRGKYTFFYTVKLSKFKGKRWYMKD
ncbi:hypothetical protein CHU_3279 [Cytophaga hutchinsonii ATCC 33406]|uniref:Uncharacterized protein n=1 Tax=Cytophaga hutchinsonii (strain ATCC 33406 / DSM 1761 / CIP 103989 / NBRC 15051 / NCIMB 9469 / D465) TaxID=269798 RepID=A0A6N4SVG1_CYTH3|nr:hypothetical protein CHU_3279 [Cytophaga hutchinsonii ATCC 33406]